MTNLRDRSSLEDVAQHWPAQRAELGEALALATYCAAELARPCWVKICDPIPGAGRHPVHYVTDFEPSRPIARVMPDGLITTNPDGRPEFLPASWGPTAAAEDRRRAIASQPTVAVLA